MVGVVALVKASGGTCEDVRIGAHAHGLHAAAGDRGRGGAARRCARRRADRGGGRACRRRHRAARGRQRHARLQAPPRPRAHPAGARGRGGPRRVTARGLMLDSPEATSEGAGCRALPGGRGRCPPPVYLAARARAAAAPRGRGRGGQDRGGQGAGRAPPARALVRLQCHEGIDLHHALYDWDYPRQLLHRSRARRPRSSSTRERFLLRRPLLEALRARRAGGAADRRDRPRRRRVRGVPARAAVGLPGDDPGAGHGQRASPAAR